MRKVFSTVKDNTKVLGPTWGEWANDYSFNEVKPEGIKRCDQACGDIATKVRTRECSVEDLCIGANKDYKRCNKKAAPEVCERQHGECDAEGFRLV